MQNVDVITETPGPLDPYIPAFAVDISGNCNKTMKGPEGLDAVRKRIDSVTGYKTRRSVGLHSRGRDDVCRGNAGKLFRAGRRVFGSARFQLIEPPGPFIDEIPVV